MITKEQIEALRKLMVSETPDVAASPLNQVFALAQQALAMQPRPLSEVEGLALLVYKPQGEDELSCTILRKYPSGKWCAGSFGYAWPETTLAIPLSALPKVGV
jgi:hypothetical protein